MCSLFLRMFCIVRSLWLKDAGRRGAVWEQPRKMPHPQHSGPPTPSVTRPTNLSYRKGQSRVNLENRVLQWPVWNPPKDSYHVLSDTYYFLYLVSAPNPGDFLVFFSWVRHWSPRLFSHFPVWFFFPPQTKAAVFRYSSRNEIQICTRQGCVMNSSSHRERGTPISLACLQGTWHQLVLPWLSGPAQDCSKGKWSYLGFFAWVFLFLSIWASRVAQICNVGDWFQCLGQKDPLEKGMATQSSILAWRIP